MIVRKVIFEKGVVREDEEVQGLHLPIRESDYMVEDYHVQYY